MGKKGAVLVALGLILTLGSCRSAGIRRAYIALDGAGTRRLEKDKRVFDDDGDIYAIAEVVSARPDVEVSCRWRFVSAPEFRLDAATSSDGYRPLNNTDPHAPFFDPDHNFLILNYPGKTDNGIAQCIVYKSPGAGEKKYQIDWDPSGRIYGDVIVDWYIGDSLEETSTFQLVHQRRCFAGSRCP